MICRTPIQSLLMSLLLMACIPIGMMGQRLRAKDQSLILQVIHKQENAWNQGNLETFMVGYWESDSLMFIGKSGLTYGWKATLANYQRSYPDTAAMGKLSFHILSLKGAGKRAAFMVGQWHLTREQGDLQGHFSLLWRKLDGHWVIAADHSS